jgi:hypothetical protein
MHSSTYVERGAMNIKETDQGKIVAKSVTTDDVIFDAQILCDQGKQFVACCVHYHHNSANGSRELGGYYERAGEDIVYC